MQLAVCGSGGDPNCYGTNTTIGGRKTARRKTARRSRRSRRGGARRSRRRGVRGGRQSGNSDMALSQMPVHQIPQVRRYRGGGNASEFLPAVCREGGLDC